MNTTRVGIGSRSAIAATIAPSSIPEPDTKIAPAAGIRFAQIRNRSGPNPTTPGVNNQLNLRQQATANSGRFKHPRLLFRRPVIHHDHFKRLKSGSPKSRKRPYKQINATVHWHH